MISKRVLNKCFQIFNTHARTMSSKRVLYGVDISPPVRAVRMSLAALELDYEYKIVDPQNGDLQTPEFLKKNPQHTVPTLEDKDGFCIWDSHAIMAYLVRRYGKTDALYPKDFYQRAVVDQRLHFENGVLFIGLGRNGIGLIFQGITTKEQLPEFLKSLTEAYELLETFLGNNQFIAGNSLTIADFSVVSIFAAFVCVIPVESAKFPKLAAWYERMKKLPYYDSVNAEGIWMLEEQLKPKLAELYSS